MEVDHRLVIHYTAAGRLIIGYIGSKVAARFPTGLPPSYFDRADRVGRGQQRYRRRFMYKETRLFVFSMENSLTGLSLSSAPDSQECKEERLFTSDAIKVEIIAIKSRGRCL